MKKIVSLIIFGLCVSSAFAFNCPSSITCTGNTLNTCFISDPNFKFLPGPQSNMPVTQGEHPFMLASGSIPVSSITPTSCSYANNVPMTTLAVVPTNPNAVPDVNNKNWYKNGATATSYMCVAGVDGCPMVVSSKK